MGIWAALATGCASLPDWSLFNSLRTSPAATGQAGYDFSWRLSGDRQAGPIQIFDDGRSTWLQFAPQQPIPAIFSRSEQGDQLLAHRTQGPYVVVDGVWSLLIMRAGALQSQARRLYPQPEASLPEPPPSHVSQYTSDNAFHVAPPGSSDPSAITVSQSETVAAPQPLAPPLSDEAVAFSLDTASDVEPASRYGVAPHDGNMRLALLRWARSAGWTFEAEHWAVDVDIPIAGTAVFDLDFTEAVQQLLASTELSERPLQPCFYANKVLRVVSYSQSCNRGAAMERI